MNEPELRRPGDLILDHYLPNATAEEREEARTNLKSYAALIIDINRRIVQQTGDKAIRPNAMEDVNSVP